MMVSSCNFTEAPETPGNQSLVGIRTCEEDLPMMSLSLFMQGAHMASIEIVGVLRVAILDGQGTSNPTTDGFTKCSQSCKIDRVAYM
jgi:hypothetical protein